MSDIINRAKEYLHGGLSVIPTGVDKAPIIPSWAGYQKTLLPVEDVAKVFKRAEAIAIICGKVSGGLEVIDVDTKNDLTGTLWEELQELLRDNLPEIYESLVIARSPSGGYHIYYLCEQIAGNTKLAVRLSTAEERIKKPGEKVKDLVETRGEGGIILAEPSPGYKFIQGSPLKLPTITPEQREVIRAICRSFTLVENTDEPTKPTAPPVPVPQGTGLTPWEDYNSKDEVLTLLEKHGWSRVKTVGERIFVKHGGETKSKYSGNFHTGLRLLKVFSTSTEFSTDKAYTPFGVYALLECNGDAKEATRKLRAQGYGDSYRGSSLLKTEKIQVTSVNPVTSVSRVISEPGEVLSREALVDTSGEDAIIYAPGEDSQDEVLRAIDFLQRAGRRVYVNLGGGLEVREFKYQIRTLADKYLALQDEGGGLTDRAIDSFLDAVVKTSQGLPPVDKDIFNKYLLSLPALQELGVKEESLTITLDRIRATQDKETQRVELQRLLQEAIELQEEGNISGALRVLEGKLAGVKLKDKETEFSKLLKRVTEAEIRERYANKPESIDTGLYIGEEPLLLPSGGISIFSAPTSHGKTAVLLNLLLNTADKYPDKKFYLFSYEEDEDAILLKALNTYQGANLSANNRRTIEDYYRTGSTKFIRLHKKPGFIQAKERFYKELVDTQRITVHYTSYTSDLLVDSIRYLSKHGNPGAIFIDYIQLINLPNGKYKTYSRQEEIKQICIALKDVAVETGLPIILGAQFNRDANNPMRLFTKYIGEAGDIERIANVIVGLWNNQFKVIATDAEVAQASKRGSYEGAPSIYAEILKNRDGRVGSYDNWDWVGNTGEIKNGKPSTQESSKQYPQEKPTYK